MKQAIKLSGLFFLMLSTLASCSKGGEKPDNQEASLIVMLDPDPGSTTTAVKTTSTTYTFNVVVQSIMPPEGVSIKVDYVKDSGGSVFSQTQTSSTATTAFTISNIPFNELGTVTVVTTSVSKSTNSVSKTFKLVRK